MYLNNLNKEQKAAVTFSGKHLLLLAGAGTGKTMTIISRAAWLIENNVDSSRLKIISFTRKSANEIAVRAAHILAEGRIDAMLQGSTFHGWCLEIIRANPDFFHMGGWTIIDGDDQEVVMRLAFNKEKSSLTDSIKASDILSIRSFRLNTDCEMSVSVRKFLCNKFGDQATESYLKSITGTIEHIIGLYEEYKKQHRYLDYDDILIKAVDALTQNTALRQRVTSRYDHILVDEMQDTNPLQWKLLEIFMPSCHLFCVGDDAQSIYAFRGADFHSIHSFKERVPDSAVMKLVRNYRSSQAILDVSNQLLEISPLNYEKKLVAQQKKGKKPLLVFVNNKAEEAAFIESDIKEHLKNGAHYADHMVLARNAYQAKQVEATLLANHIPYVLYGGISLLKSAHIRDVVSTLRIIANPHDELAWMRYLELWPGIGESKAKKMIGSMKDKNTLEEMVELMKDTTHFSAPAQVIRYALSQSMDTQSCLSGIVESLVDLLSDKYQKDWNRRKKDFAALIEIAANTKSLSGFINDYVLDPQSGTNSATDDAVIISTIHSAKGLEADYCYILDMCIGSYPCDIAIKEGADAIEEERRCLYVALTRPRKQLAIMTEYNTWEMATPCRMRPGTIKTGDYYVANKPTPSDPPFKKVQITAIQGTEVSFHQGGKTCYASSRDFSALYRVKEELFPGLSIPHFFFSNISLDLFECKSGSHQTMLEGKFKMNNNNTKFKFF